MPSSMIHLLAAYKYDPKSSVAFFIGNIVPDIISEWKEKDRSHFRDRKDRLNALKELANTININDDFNRGVLLHLYLDYKWDTYPMKKFKEGFEKDTWFRPYRYEISLAGAWLYHNRDWSKDLWEKIISCPMTSYENNFGYEKRIYIIFYLEAINGIGIIKLALLYFLHLTLLRFLPIMLLMNLKIG